MSVSWKKVKEQIHEVTYGKQYQTVIIAVSGGSDSLLLLDLMRRFDLITKRCLITHFNHLPGQRMDEGAELAVVKYCKDEGLPLNIGRGNIEEMLEAPSFEAEARRQRYVYFLRAAWEKQGNNTGRVGIITAHSLSDQVEGILMGICRGVPAANTAMAKTTLFPKNNVAIIRPFLGISKTAIVKQAIKYGLKNRWEEDVTNYDIRYERNYMRHVVVPMLLRRRNILKSIPKSIPTPELITVTQGTLFSCVDQEGLNVA